MKTFVKNYIKYDFSMFLSYAKKFGNSFQAAQTSSRCCFNGIINKNKCMIHTFEYFSDNFGSVGTFEHFNDPLIEGLH